MSTVSIDKSRLTDVSVAITIVDNNGVIWRRVGTNLALLPLGGGNVMVKAK